MQVNIPYIQHIGYAIALDRSSSTSAALFFPIGMEKKPTKAACFEKGSVLQKVGVKTLHHRATGIRKFADIFPFLTCRGL